jgi:SAM-dependent methyltransferase
MENIEAMHTNSMIEMQRLIKKYLKPENRLSILDVGSRDVCGCYRGLFDPWGLPDSCNWTYTGLDIEPGKNVDIVADSHYRYPIRNCSYDVAISGQTLEHVQDTHLFILELKRVLKPNGLLILIAPWQWEEHRCPIDCWRILPDGMRFLLSDVANMQVIEVYKSENDCIGVASNGK